MSDCTSAAASFDAETRSLPLCDVTWAATPGHPFVAFVESETTPTAAALAGITELATAVVA